MKRIGVSDEVLDGPSGGGAPDDADAGRGVSERDALAPIDISCEHVHPDNVDKAMIERAAIPLRRLPLREAPRIVVTGDLEASYGERVSRFFADPFRQERLVGRVIAKTVTDKDSSTVILLDAAALEPGVRNSGTLSRLLLHEGLHLLLRDRGEDAHAAVRDMNPSSEIDTILYWIAALALDEYRVETQLCGEGNFLTISLEAELTSILAAYRSVFDEIGANWGEAAAQRLLPLASGLMDKLALAAAENKVRVGLGERLLENEDWKGFIGDHWMRMRMVLERLPAAKTKMAADDLFVAIRSLAAIAAGWCEQLGFRLEDDGGLCLQPLRQSGIPSDAAAQSV